MSNIMSEFLNSAGERAAVVLAEQGVVRSAEERIKAEQDANSQTLQGIISREFGPVLDVLRGLPEKDGKSFTARISDRMPGQSTAARYEIFVSYQEQQSGRSRHFSDNLWQPAVVIFLSLDKGKLAANIVQHSLAGKDGQGRSVKTSSFDEMRRELGLGIGNFAADRVEEIQKTAVSGPPPEPVKSEPAHGWSWPKFFH